MCDKSKVYNFQIAPGEDYQYSIASAALQLCDYLCDKPHFDLPRKNFNRLLLQSCHRFPRTRIANWIPICVTLVRKYQVLRLCDLFVFCVNIATRPSSQFFESYEATPYLQLSPLRIPTHTTKSNICDDAQHG